MNFKKVIFISFVTLFTTYSGLAQQTAIYTNSQKDYDHAIELYHNKAYVAAQEKFNSIKSAFDNASEIKANCEYYAANCAVRLGQPNSDQLMQDFVDNYPTSTKRSSAFIDVANYYYKVGKYAYASKWFAKVEPTTLSLRGEEDYNFKYAYSLFVNKKYQTAKQYFLNLLDSQEYGAQAKYYYGYIAYQQDDYETADKYLGDVVDDSSFKTDVSYYLADMNFKLGKFEKAIENGLPLLEKARRTEHSEISKIVGESYFNLQDYEQSITHLKNYKGKRGKWTNTDYYLLGYAYFKQEDFENAISTFNKIISGNNAVAQNAYYHLAECYLNVDKKQEALNAFRNATQMKFKPEIQKDAWLNYAKLSYDIGNPYQSVPDVLLEYLELYPKSEHKKEINDLIISAYIRSKDYKGALTYLENKKGIKERKLLQKVAFYRGVELFQEGQFEAATTSFEQSIGINLDSNITTRSIFWLAESNYRMNNFLDALANFKKFDASQNASQTNEKEHFNYNLAYTYFKLKDYDRASSKFKKYVQNNTSDEVRTNDSYLRIGDGYFVNRNYTNANTYYDKAIALNGIDTDYAKFQKAISLGLLGNETAKIDELISFLDNYSRSSYSDDAHFVLGNSYIKKSENEFALNHFEQLITNYRRSPLVSKAMLKKGLIYYNTDQNNLAISTYKNVVNRFPNTAEAKQAIQNTRQIYVDIGRVDEYADWVKGIDFVNVTDAELDNDMYESSEKQYLQNNHKRAIESFKNYLRKFPNGVHALHANFYLAQSLYSENRLSETVPYYSYVIQQEQTEFTEDALSRLSLVYLKDDNWPQAIPVLERLEIEADLPQNIIFARTNLMKGYYANKNYSKAVAYAETVLSNSKLEDRIKSDAHIIVARSAIQTNEQAKARAAYKEVEKTATGELKAEALYYSAYYENGDGSYRVSNQIVQKIAADYAPYKYWAAKGLIIMANNHYELKDAYQATYILESVIKNFNTFDDVVQEASVELSRIKTEQAKTNESVTTDGN